MANPAPFTLILVANNGGGDGKTAWTEALQAIAHFAGRRTTVLDVDPGLCGYSRRNGADAADRMSWSGDLEDGRGLPEWLAECMNHEIALVDTGANLLSADREVSARLQEIATYAQSKGGRLILHAVTSPNKAGSGKIVESLYHLFAPAMEFAVIMNRRDGSELFSKEVEDLPAPKVLVPYVSPGLQAYRLKRAQPLNEIITAPEPGYKMASGLFAEYLREIAGGQHIQSIVGADVLRVLQNLSDGVASYQGNHAKTIKAISDAALHAAHDCLVAYREFVALQPARTEAFLAAALRYRAALIVREALD